ncbi:hypothetical protein [Actinomadura parmotrematis]|uniref:LppX_LprAFG lipoprotein n=1 Tax=Actinomadura parmotrematis TaxID=2864039 RepID=A0ABS7FXH9_9ACTN|nr:hypothetical protein [Actinomadura parmotrematis]MBW8485144.1 hypothetical protein [Actinomadura parmotrematis]
MKRSYAVAAGSTAVGAALLLSGCNADGTGGTDANLKLTANQALIKTSQKAAKANTFKADVTVKDTSEGGQVHATGQFRLRPDLAFSAQVDSASKGSASIPLSGSQAIFTSDTLYVKAPSQLRQFIAGGKPWLKIDVTQLQQRTGVDVKGLVGQVEQADPAQQTKMFTGSKDVRRVGTETVDGVKTTHYAGSVTVKDALAQLDAQQRSKASQWLSNADQNSRIKFDLWSDGDNLPRKLVSTGQGKDDNGSVQVLYTDYGKSVTVNAPPSDQVGQLSLNGLLGGNTPKPAPTPTA